MISIFMPKIPTFFYLFTKGCNSPKLGRVQPPESLKDPRLRGQLLRPSHESDQARLLLLIHLPAQSLPRSLQGQILRSAPALLPPVPQALGEYPLPLDDLRPGALVEEVVHRHHRLDRLLRGVRVSFAQHGIVHLLGRGVLPVPLPVASGDRGDFPLDGEVDGLVRCPFLGDVGEHVIQRVELGEG